LGELLFFVAVVVVDTDERPAKGEYLSKCYQQRVVYLAHWWCHKSRREQCAPEGAHYYRGDELDLAHNFIYLDRFAVGRRTVFTVGTLITFAVGL